MSKGFFVILVKGRGKYNYGYCESRTDAYGIAKSIYEGCPRRYDCHVEIVNRKTGEVTVL